MYYVNSSSEYKEISILNVSNRLRYRCDIWRIFSGISEGHNLQDISGSRGLCLDIAWTVWMTRLKGVEVLNKLIRPRCVLYISPPVSHLVTAIQIIISSMYLCMFITRSMIDHSTNARINAQHSIRHNVIILWTLGHYNNIVFSDPVH
jgi:hypothetical protein